MKRTALKRKTPLRRKTWMKRSSKRNSYARRARDTDFMLWCKKQPCIVRDVAMVPASSDPDDHFPPLTHVHLTHPCTGEVQADHMGERAMGRKAADDTCVPICRTHHDQRTNGWGVFFGWTKAWKRAFRARAIALIQARARREGVLP